MKHGVISAIGALAGLATGSFLVPQPLLGFFSAVHVAWDSSQCPPGDYSLTSTATNLQTGESFQTTPARFNLPAGAIGQDFADLPNGTYQLWADVASTDGQSFHSATQTLTVGSDAPAPPLGSGSEDQGHQRPPTSAPIGNAVPRNETLSGSGAAPASGAGSPAGSNALPASGGGSGGGSNELPVSRGGATAGVASPREPQVLGDVPIEFALRVVAMFSTDLSGGDGGGAKMSVTGIDADGDGTIDFLSITVGDTVLIWRVVH